MVKKSKGITTFFFGFLLSGFFLVSVTAEAGGEKINTEEQKSATPYLTEEVAYNFSRLALNCIQKEYPNKMDHVMNDQTEVKAPSFFHPAFYGCFDWHSSVHGHWMLVRLLKLHPEIRNASEIRSALDKNLSTENIKKEVIYLNQPNRKSFERTYGWAWALKLAEELCTWDDPDGKKWSQNLQPLVKELVNMCLNFFPKQTYPIRTGVHPNTAFGIAFAYDYALKTDNKELLYLIRERALTYYLKDTNCPSGWEPGGEDFFSPCLLEVDLMRRILSKEEFRAWFGQFLPDIRKGENTSLLNPAIVADRNDPKIVHLDGLNLSRAWCMYGIASSLATDDPIRKTLLEAAEIHSADALTHVASGNYEGEHWLASFAIYMFTMKESVH